MPKNIFDRIEGARRETQQVIDVARAMSLGAEIAQYAKLAEKLFRKDPNEPEAICIQRELACLHESLNTVDGDSQMTPSEKEKAREEYIQTALRRFNELGVRLDGPKQYRGSYKERIAQKYGQDFLASVERMGSED